MTNEERVAIVDRHLAALAEHFDCIQIGACRVLPDGSTENLHRGNGNWYARYGLSKEHALRCEREMAIILLASDPPASPEGCGS